MTYGGGPTTSEYADENEIDEEWVFSEYGEPIGPYEPTNFAAKIGPVNFMESLDSISSWAIYGRDNDVYFMPKAVRKGINRNPRIDDYFSWKKTEGILEREPTEEELDQILEPRGRIDKFKAQAWETTEIFCYGGVIGSLYGGGLGTMASSFWIGQETFEATSNYLGRGIEENLISIGAGVAGWSGTMVTGSLATFISMTILFPDFGFKAGKKARNIRRRNAVRESVDHMEEECYEIYYMSTNGAIMDLREVEGFSKQTGDDELRELLDPRTDPKT